MGENKRKTMQNVPAGICSVACCSGTKYQMKAHFFYQIRIRFYISILQPEVSK